MNIKYNEKRKSNKSKIAVPLLMFSVTLATATSSIAQANILQEEAILLDSKSSVSFARLSPKEQLNQNLDFIYRKLDNPSFGIFDGEWSILSLARGGYQVREGYYDIYYNNVVKEVQELMLETNRKPEGVLDRNKGTEHSRLILGLTSIGSDIKNVGGYDISEGLADFKYVVRQGINGPIFALIALDTNNHEIPQIVGVEKQTTRENLVKYILDREIAGGGWSLGEDAKSADPDITGMAIQGLATYYNTNPNVKASIDRAVDWLSVNQDNEGGYSSWGAKNTESISQVIVGLTSIGIDPHKDTRFTKNGNSMIDSLMEFADPQGGFMHIKPGGGDNGGAVGGTIDAMATDQGTYALVAYDRLVSGKNRLYDMTDASKSEEVEDSVVKELTDILYRRYTSSVNNIEAKKQQSKDKVWTIKFNKNLENISNFKSNIYVLDRHNKLQNVSTSRGENLKELKIIPPASGYKSKEQYTVIIKDLKSENGETLNKDTVMDFSIE